MINIKIGGFEPKSLYAKSLIPILDALEWNGSNTDLIEALVDNANDMDKDGLIHTLSNLKFKCFSSKLKRLNNRTTLFPSLYVTKKNIYIILNVREGNFLAYDTLKTEYRKIRKFEKGREILLFTTIDSEDFSLHKPQKNWFFNLISRLKKEFFYVLIISLLLTFTAFITPLFIMLIHSQIKIAQKWENIAFLGIATLIFIIGNAGFRYLRNYLLTYISTRIGNVVTKEIFRRLLYLPPKYIETSSVRSQLNRIRDFESITDFFSGSALTSIIDIPLSLIMMIGLIFISGNIVFIPLTSYFLMVIIGFASYFTFQKINERDVDSINKKNKLQNEMLEKMSMIRLTGNQERWFKEYSKYYSDALINSYKSSNFLIIVNSVSQSIVNITLLLSISVGVLKIIDGSMNSGALFSSFIIISRIMAPLKNGFSTISQFSKIKKSLTQLNKFMGIAIEDRPVSIRSIQHELDGEIKFNNIFLKYGQEISPALLNIKFSQKMLETTVITGHSGCGKSSILKLLLALYEPLSGTITADYINILQLDKIQLRKSISYLPSRPYLFPGTLKFNLYLGKPDASDSQLEISLEKAGILKDIKELKDGLETDIEDLPAKFRRDSFIKRINVAMMLIRHFPIYLIDGIEEGLDESEYEFFYDLINDLKESSTIILTTNRPEFLSLGDKIITMDSGRIKEITQVKKV